MQRPLDLYALFRLKDLNLISELNCLMSGKASSVRKHEIESLRGLTYALASGGANAKELDGYYFSYSIPRIGKEFDVLRISDDLVLNIELKYLNVGFEEIVEQQKRNEYYLRSLGKEIFICTYVYCENKFYTIDSSQKLNECPVEVVIDAVRRSNGYYTGDPDRFFDPEDYIFSPISDPQRLLDGRYFLTQHQESIEKRLLTFAWEKKSGFASVSGGSGTGKTLLLYDIALKSSNRIRVCVITSDTNTALKMNRVFDGLTVTDASGYVAIKDDERVFDAVFLDDAHLMPCDKLELIIKDSSENGRFCVLFTEAPALLNAVNRTKIFWKKLKGLVGAEKHQLTDRIRTDPTVSAYINLLLNGELINENAQSVRYGENFVLYAANRAEAGVIIDRYSQKGYGSYIPDGSETGIPPVGKRLVVLGRGFCYDSDGYLAFNGASSENVMENLVFRGFKGIDGALGVLVVGNHTLFKKILSFFK